VLNSSLSTTAKGSFNPNLKSRFGAFLCRLDFGNDCFSCWEYCSRFQYPFMFYLLSFGFLLRKADLVINFASFHFFI
jgi:hypothetical protein